MTELSRSCQDELAASYRLSSCREESDYLPVNMNPLRQSPPLNVRCSDFRLVRTWVTKSANILHQFSVLRAGVVELT